jgi:hypothetical protein
MLLGKERRPQVRRDVRGRTGIDASRLRRNPYRALDERRVATPTVLSQPKQEIADRPPRNARRVVSGSRNGDQSDRGSWTGRRHK